MDKKARRDETKAYQAAYMDYMRKVVETYENLSPEEKRHFEEFEKLHVTGDGRFGTSDWPGWEKYIGKRPLPPYDPKFQKYYEEKICYQPGNETKH